MRTDNPALRLYDILSSARAQDGGLQVRQVWGRALDVSANDLPKIYRSLGMLNELVDEVRESIKAIPDIDHELFLEELPSIKKAVTPLGLNDSWSTSASHLDPGTMKALKFCASELGKYHREDPVAHEVLSELLEEIEGLVASIIASDLNSDLKALLIDLLETARKAIIEYRLRGAVGLQRAVIYALGVVVATQNSLVKEQENPVIKQILAFIGKFDKVVSVAVKVKALCENAAPLLPQLPPPSP